MSALAPTLQAFFTQRLMTERAASPATVTAYRDGLRLFVRFAAQSAGCRPSELDFTHLDATVVGAFLDHIERVRGDGVRTRNARLAAIHSLFRYAALCHPEHAGSIQRVLAIPQKRCERALVSFLTRDETSAILAAPDRSDWVGRRDHALLVVMVQTGLRVSEATALSCADLVLGRGAHVRCMGKGRKQRCTALTPEAVSMLRVWLSERRGDPAQPAFPSRRGTPLSTDAVEYMVAKYASVASARCPSIGAKKVTPHVLRHTCAMFMREQGIDLSTIALWLGHESLATVQVYLHADLTIKEKALAMASPPGSSPGRYRPSDALMAFLETL